MRSTADSFDILKDIENFYKTELNLSISISIENFGMSKGLDINNLINLTIDEIAKLDTALK